MEIVVLDGAVLRGQELGFDALAALGNMRYYDRTPQEDAVARIGDAQIVLTNKVRITREVMEACPRLAYVGVTATGYNIVDVQAAAERGIVVTNVPAYSTLAVAQHVFALLLHDASRVAAYDARVHAGEWVSCPDFCFISEPARELAGSTLGIVGYGSIGQTVARIALAMGIQVLVYTRTPRADEPGIRFVSLETLLAQSDVLTLHCPLTEATRDMLDAAAIARMKPGVRVINTARGPLVDEQAMADALRSGQVGCFMADVLSEEPPTAENPLLHAPNVVLTPHIAWAPLETRKRLMDIAVDNVRAYLAGAPRNVVDA